MSVLSSKVLILNKNWFAFKVRNVKDAIKLVSRERAVFVDGDNYCVYNWEEWLKLVPEDDEPGIETTGNRVKVPKVVVLTVYGKIPNKAPKKTKKNIFIRDNYRCQYTGEEVSMKNADLDHIVPSSRGGSNDWDNLVVCSKTINRKKRNRTPEEAGLKLIRKPRKPTWTTLMIDPKMTVPEYWKKFLHEK